LYESMLKSSNATVHLESPGIFRINIVDSVEKLNDGGYRIATNGQEIDFDMVVLAAPTHQSDIKFINLDFKVPSVDYVQLYGTSILNTVTIVFGEFDPKFFKLESVNQVPMEIMTPSDKTSTAPFHSCGVLDQLNKTHTLVKIFSQKELKDSFVDTMFTGDTKIWRHYWNGSYPNLPPLSPDWNFPVVVDNGFWYANGFERWISTMETQTISARNIANLIISKISGRTDSVRDDL
jgi:prenylcysteine oxidase/farnesylcysteine lyase